MLLNNKIFSVDTVPVLERVVQLAEQLLMLAVRLEGGEAVAAPNTTLRQYRYLQSIYNIYIITHSKNINILSTCRHLLKILIPAWTRLTELQATSLRPGQAEARRLRTYRYVDMLVRASRGGKQALT